MVDWQQIHTVLLDMDGTLLDLHFDNYFWREHVPLRFAEKHQISVDHAKDRLFPQFREKEGTMEWYCVDYWSDTLDLDIAMLKAEVDHLISIHPYVLEFLSQVRAAGKTLALVTNAHQKSLMLKLERTALHNHLDHVICSHDFGMPKENPQFWDKLKGRLPFENNSSLLIDDSLAVLRSARGYGIRWLLAVRNPDSKTPPRTIDEFEAIDSFSQILPVV
ncbi:MAG: GMP/IMP nucleotidase [Gammaproteobacteria bacterium]